MDKRGLNITKIVKKVNKDLEETKENRIFEEKLRK